MKDSIESLLQEKKNPYDAISYLLEELFSIKKIMQIAKQDLTSLRLTHQPGPINEVYDELEEVIESTKSATFKILDAAENLEKLIPESVDKQKQDAFSQEITSIYEASTFQDLSGQRIRKVIDSFKEIESRLKKVSEHLGDKKVAEGIHIQTDSALGSKKDPLLNGPQLTGLAPNQNDIDKMFD